eukprot:12420305-Ditylum_brightwellii.AAC.1
MSVRHASTEVHALVFMPHLQPLRARLGNLNHKGGHTKRGPPSNQCGTEGSKVGVSPLVFGGEGHWLKNSQTSTDRN